MRYSLEERLEYHADVLKKTKARLWLYKSQIKKLEKQGFLVTYISTTERAQKSGQMLCMIDWTYPTSEGSFADSLLQLSQK